LATVNFLIPPNEELDKLNDEDLAVVSRNIAKALFHTKPPPDEIRNTLAGFIRYLAEKRDAKTAHRFIVEHMGPYTSRHCEEYAEENDDYMQELSVAIHNHGDYQHAFTLIGDAMQKGEIETVRPPVEDSSKPAD
jgi:hypothetical protein